MIINKNAELSAASVNEETMKLINTFTKRELKPDEVFTFSLRLCDNLVDRDMECFSYDALCKLSQLFVGKTGISDHDWKSGGQLARIYSAGVEIDRNKTAQDGKPYAYVKADAYMMRTAENESIIKDIEGGIKKEVSVGCSVGKKTCSICGKNADKCNHEKGKLYNGKMCYFVLEEPKDAYEWSFVAVPAQKGAGVIKHFSDSKTPESIEELFSQCENKTLKKKYDYLEKYAELGKKYMAILKNETVDLMVEADIGSSKEFFAELCDMCNEYQLNELKKIFGRLADEKYGIQCQLPTNKKLNEKFSDDEFII